MSLDVAALRAQFPILSKTVDGKPLVYLDNAATTYMLQEQEGSQSILTCGCTERACRNKVM